jgi:putative FmdB family regulatory protein
MPRYDYVCPSCGHEIVNVKQSLAEHNEPMKCPKCGVVMEQHFDSMNFILGNCGGWTTKTGGGVGRKK